MWPYGPHESGYSTHRCSLESAFPAIGPTQEPGGQNGSGVKDDKQYEGLRKKGMSKERAAKISNANAGSGNAASKKGGKKGGKKSGSKSS